MSRFTFRVPRNSLALVVLWLALTGCASQLSAPALVTPTPVPTLPPTTTPFPTPIVFGNKTLVYYGVTLTNSDGWMTILSAEDASRDFKSADKNLVPLRVRIDLWKSFPPEELKGMEILVVDSEGHEYKRDITASFSGGMSMKDGSGQSVSIQAKGNGYIFVFPVPKNTQGFTFKFQGFPPFDLGYPLPK